ncbi:MAG TPA: serine/threonine-protein kinase [Pseudonocardiaceae bacterium]|nr:serine/threonine-protein kinase [Pseudonocardiaceae bacterium]
MIAGHYRLLERIGSGAMGVVWRARDERLERIVAIKQLLLQPGLGEQQRQEARKRAMREARIAARLHHSNAIVVFDVAEHEGDPCLVMEYLPARSLAAVLTERGSLPVPDVAAMGSQIAAALAAAHASGIVHRDIKPGNVLINDDGVAKITDFGIARAAGDLTLTQTGTFAGTPAYLAPEVARGQDPTSASDVFSLGATLYDAVEGGPPFPERTNQLALLHLVAEGKIEPPKQAGELTSLLMKLLRANPAERPNMAQASSMLAELGGARPLRPAVLSSMSRPTLPDLARVDDAPAQPAPASPRPLPGPSAPLPPPTQQGMTGLAGLFGERTDAPPTAAVPSAGSTPSSVDRRKRTVLITVVVLVVVVAGGLIGWLVSSSSGSPQAGGGTPSTNTSAPPTSSSSAPTTTSAPSGSGVVDISQAGNMVIDFYNKLLTNPSAVAANAGTAWNELSPTAQAFYGTEQQFIAYWSGYSQVYAQDAHQVYDNPDGSAGVPFNLTVLGGTSGGSGQAQHKVYQIIRAQNGQLLINSDTRY